MRKTGIIGIMLIGFLTAVRPVNAAAAENLPAETIVDIAIDTEGESVPGESKEETESPEVSDDLSEEPSSNPEENIGSAAESVTVAADDHNEVDAETDGDTQAVNDPETENISENTNDVQTGNDPENNSDAQTADGSENLDVSEPLVDSYTESDPVTEETLAAQAGMNLTEKTEDRIHFIALNGIKYSSDSILIESNGLYGLIDSSNPSEAVVENLYPSNTDPGANGQTVVQYLKDIIKIDHLKFVLGTHSHSDHIGGMPDIAASGMVDSNTVYIYKEYELEGQREWHNDYYLDLAKEAMKAQGAVLLNLLSPDGDAMRMLGAEEVHDSTDSVGDHIRFTMGDFLIKLFNIHNESTENDNLNSIVTTVQKDDKRAVLMADIEMSEHLESRVTNVIVHDDGFSGVDVFKVGHHGGCSSTNLSTIKAFNPEYSVVTTRDSQPEPFNHTFYNYYIEQAGNSIYRTSENLAGIIADFGAGKISMLKVAEDGTEEDAFAWKATITDGWHAWYPTEDNFIYTGIRWTYIQSGSALKGWFTVDGRKYYSDNDGVTLYGLRNIDGATYAFGKNGAILTGWQIINGKWHYFKEDGKALNGWLKYNGKWFYFKGNSDGEMCVGWLTYNGKRYYFTNSGMITGWKKIDNKWYLFGNGGAMLTGWQRVGSSWYYLDESGVMLTGMQQVGSKTYFFSSSGAMVTGWQKKDNKWYLFGNGGAMLTGWQQVGSNWYYLDESGAMVTGLKKIGGKTYYFSAGGVMLTGWQRADGKWHYFGNSGAMLTGWQRIGGSWYYLDESGVMLTGWQKIAGKWYYFNSNGIMAANTWVEVYYLTASGQMAVNQQIGDYYVGADGKRVTLTNTAQ